MLTSQQSTSGVRSVDRGAVAPLPCKSPPALTVDLSTQSKDLVNTKVRYVTLFAVREPITLLTSPPAFGRAIVRTLKLCAHA